MKMIEFKPATEFERGIIYRLLCNKRAKNMVVSTGNRIGLMRSARMGVFQITPANSYEISSWGINDTSSLDKKVTAVVHVSFAIME